MHEDTFILKKPVKLEELLRRWPGISEEELFRYVSELRITSYSISKSFLSPNGLVHECLKTLTFGDVEPGDAVVINNFKERVYDLDDIEDIEKRHPHFRYSRAQLRNSKTQDLDQDVINEWKNAIASSSLKPAPKKRITILVMRLAGEKVASILLTYPTRNIERDIRDAKEKDVPLLRNEFPNLPDIGV